MATETQPTPALPTDRYDQPVAYDKDGRPLYAHPPRAEATPIVHVSRSFSPVNQPVPPEIQKRHEESVRKYPQLNLSEAEYVIVEVNRHPIGIFQIWAVVLALVAAFSAVFGLLAKADGISDAVSLLGGGAVASAALLMLVFLVFIIIGGLVLTHVYSNNHFFLTNESVIQEIQTTLFSRHEQTVSLANIEDASYQQSGIIQSLFNYGTLRLSTEGDETTYRFTFAANPKHRIAVLNNAVEAFKNGRPINPDED